MAASSDYAEQVAEHGPSVRSGSEGPSGVVAYTIKTDAGKATALAKLAGGESLVVQAHLVTVAVAADGSGSFQFSVSDDVVGRVRAWREKRGARADYFLWIGHAGPGYLSAHEGEAVGPPEIAYMHLVPPEPATRQV